MRVVDWQPEFRISIRSRLVSHSAFEVRPGTRIEDFRAALAEQTVFYQPASDRVRNVLDLRHKRPATYALAAAE